MHIVDQLYSATEWVVFCGLLALRVWALVDCVTRRAAAFPAADKLTKPAWLAILLVAGALGTLLGLPNSPYSSASNFSLISAIAASIYLADVRPAVREISSP